MSKVTVRLVPGTTWTIPGQEVQAIGISRYQLIDNGGSAVYRYTLGITNNAGWTFTFWDESGDSYDVATVRNGDHFVSYNSKKPIIVAVE